ncbi:MAG: hypothetical protein P8J32_00195 [bacterium]|nr:hypothetical protein [bacterium]
MNIKEIFKGAFFFKDSNEDQDGTYSFRFRSDAQTVAYKLKNEENGVYIVYDYNYDSKTLECTFAHCSLVEKQDNGIFARPDKTGVLRSIFKELEDELTPLVKNSKNRGNLIKFTNG